MTLTWDPPHDRTDRDGAIIQYRLNCESMHSNLVVTDSEVANSSTSLTQLLPHHEYTCCVSVETTNGKSSRTCTTFTSQEEGTYCVLVLH